MKIIAAIPAYNADKHIEGVVKRTLKERVDELVIVDDGSKDSTWDILTKLAKKFKNIKIVQHKKNKGYGGAQKTLFRTALKEKADIVIILHSDGQHLPEEIPVLLKPLINNSNNNADIVQGSRALGNMLKGGMPLYKYIGNRFLTFLENKAFGTKLSTFHCGYKAIKKAALEKMNFLGLTNGFFYDSEFLLEANKKKLKIFEVPITTVYHYKGYSGVNSLRYGFDIIKLVISHKMQSLKRK